MTEESEEELFKKILKAEGIKTKISYLGGDKMTEESEEELFKKILKAEGIKTKISYLEHIARLIKKFPHWLEIIKERFSLKI